MHSAEAEAYANQFENLSSISTTAFKDYYVKSIEQDFLQYSSRWMFESINLYSPASGITNNINENFNVLTSRNQRYQHNYAIGFYELAPLSLFDIKLGCAQVGNFLKPDMPPKH